MAKKANSNLLKDAIADARVVRETALKNAQLAIEEALTPRIQSIISRKIQAEMEEEDNDDVLDTDMAVEEEDVMADLEFEPETDDVEESDEFGDEEDVDMDVAETFEDPDADVTGSTYDVTEDDDMDSEEEFDEDELDLESVIRELEDELDDDDDLEMEGEDEMDDDSFDDADDDDELDIEIEDDEEDDDDEFEMDDESDDEIDLDEILREMGYGDDEDEMTEEEEEEVVPVDNTDELEAELDEAYKTIRVLKKTINEVNLLNAKLLYANKVFRQYNLTTEQKRKIVESFDRTGSVREVKLVFATISESMKLTGTTKIKKITEGFASKPTKSTAPKGIIKEDVDFGMTEFQKRNKELAGIITK